MAATADSRALTLGPSAWDRPWKVSDCDSCGAPETRLMDGLVLGVCSRCWQSMEAGERRRARIAAERRYRSLLAARQRPSGEQAEV